MASADACTFLDVGLGTEAASCKSPSCLVSISAFMEVTPGDVPTRPVQAGDETSLDRVYATAEDDWNR
jgi:hypothetical protein